MGLFSRLFLFAGVCALLSACGNAPADQSSDTSKTTVNVDVGNEAALAEAYAENPELQHDSTIIARAKAAALKKAAEGNVNAHFKEIAPEEVKEKLVDKAKPVEEIVDGQKFRRVENNKTIRTRIAPQQRPEPIHNDKINSGFTASQTKTSDGKVVPITRAPHADATAPTTSDLHATWDALLKKHVSVDGRVNYSGFKANKAKLEKYLDLLAQTPPQKNWPRAKEMAYWINLYNAATIKLIVDNMPLKSIKDLDGGKVWDRKWIKVGSKVYSLNNIENDILRPKFKDARIHFAVNCAAKSCPPLWNRAWTAQNLERQLDDRARIFINNDRFNQLHGMKIRISPIFQWYAADFGDLITFLNKYAIDNIPSNVEITYQDYDWSLNGK
ncbi:MAG: DUF547 domain-containing protein [Bacteroidetes bacterium]|nr:MAG: DUF547 domain-containing protein [Bacteroidota bacterium]